ncbi:PepSY domain-containing protein [Acidovorax sp. FJL06]|uniref:PepSY-associated TM helix domain-containing protein n=1 Tax=Acidovorax sp. FJL06 TaxID=2153365 RepID=UPI000F568F05|nr:PepSY-associated TM helix domain-containing protein [Acidovorax sp. FJL06]RQO82912.1 PepSY domain-containing protein [Acidovorax sp. FJL06]
MSTETALRQAKAPKAPNDREGLRQAMAWLHTWAGLILGWLLFAIFLTGTLSFFRSEFNLWMRPEMHGLPSADMADAAHADAQVAQKSLDALARKVPGVTQWIMNLPDDRDPAVSILWRDTGNGRFETLRMNPQTGEAINTRQTMGGDFFYRFHFELRTAQKGRWTQEGRWVVGVATMLMFVALISGVITHRRIFKDFFTFRPAKGGQRAWLDAHNVTGVLVLPFYLMITFSGLMLFHTLYMPAGIATAYKNEKGVDSNAYFADLQGEKAESRARRGAGDKVEPLPAIALQPILEAARSRWDGGHIGRVQARRDAKGRAVVEVTRHEGDRLQHRPPRLLFDANTGQWLDQADATGPATRTYGVLVGLHMAHFAGTGLRWALFGFGLLGSLMIATGMVLWSVKRSAKSQASQAQASRKGAAAAAASTAPAKPPFGERLVAGINIATLAGLPLACGVYLASNRLVPLDTEGRADTELAWFFSAWGLALLWALACTVVRPGRMGWSVPLGAAGLVWALLPVINALTTHAHLGITLPAGEWVWASMDLAFLATGLLLGWLSWRLRPGRTPHGKAPRAAAPAPAVAAALPAAPDVSTSGA